MKRTRITHVTEYHYHEPVKFGLHRALLRPREGHDLHIESSRLIIEPDANVRQLRDVFGNSVAIIIFTKPARKLRLFSEVNVDLYDNTPIDCVIDPIAQSYPFHYGANEQVEIIQYRLPSYPHDGPALQQWVVDLYQPGKLINTAELWNNLNTRIFQAFQYNHREEPGVQLPYQTLDLGTGSCRDYAVFMMEAGRHWVLGQGLSPATPRWATVSTAPPTHERRFTFRARTGEASIPPTTNSPETSTSLWR